MQVYSRLHLGPQYTYTWLPDPSRLGLATTPNLRYMSMINMSYLTNNKQRGQLCTLVVRREKRKKKHKQSITGSNPIIICLHTPHHVLKGTIAHLVRWQMAKFGVGAAYLLGCEEHTPTTF